MTTIRSTIGWKWIWCDPGNNETFKTMCATVADIMVEVLDGYWKLPSMNGKERTEEERKIFGNDLHHLTIIENKEQEGKWIIG